MPAPREFAHLGLTFTYPPELSSNQPAFAPAPLLRRPEAAALAAGPTEPAPAEVGVSKRPKTAALAPGPTEPAALAPEAAMVPYRVELSAPSPPPGPATTIEVDIEPCPPRPLMSLALARRLRHGASLEIGEAGPVSISGRTWYRTRYRYQAGDPRPQTALTGVEFALAGEELLYRVTVRGPDAATEDLAARLAPSLRAPPAHQRWRDALSGLGEGRSSPTQPGGWYVSPTESVVAVVAANWTDPADRALLEPAAVGTGVVVTADGVVLTSFHVVYDERRRRLHDLVLLGRSRAGVLDFVCAGTPARDQPERARDLARVRCTMDMSGQPLAPTPWPAARAAEVFWEAPAQPAWILGYPEATAGALDTRRGRLTRARAGDDLLTTEARVDPGFSGGPAVNEQGALLGIVIGYRDRVELERGEVRRIRIGLVRPLANPGHAGPGATTSTPSSAPRDD
ncbi:S1 family peptidase [Haliangium sp.]|uniref:S1 family peptidase n=1 Tax=Haliangium sp. TaxID=2663208 RepID=UPI003D118260